VGGGKNGWGKKKNGMGGRAGRKKSAKISKIDACSPETGEREGARKRDVGSRKIKGGGNATTVNSRTDRLTSHSLENPRSDVPDSCEQ